ncbi:MAG: DUF4276 family protein [Phocaeicola sp.]|nr:DUF4276 family protein [Phocaeicola sp.]
MNKNNDYVKTNFSWYHFRVTFVQNVGDTPNTAPSERLKKAIKEYDKIVYESCLAYDIGLKTIREKCILFNEWIGKLENC